MISLDVLIVEDSATQALLLKRTLESRGLRVRVAKNGIEALERVEEEEPTIIISDIEMPEMDGCEFSKRIKDDPRRSHIPIILVTALSNPEDVIRAMQSGADNFITKPYDEDFLFTRIYNILENKKLRSKEKKEPITISLYFGGEEYRISADRFQIMDLLLSSFEAAIEQNDRLLKKEVELREAKTATEKAYERLHASTTQLRKLSQAVEQSPVSVLITNRDGIIEYVNPVFSRITGYSREEVLGENPCLLKSGRHSLEFYQKMWGTILEGNVWQGEICNKKKSGELYWESASIAPLQDSTGEINHFVAVREDVTERRQREEEFRIIIETALDGFCITNLKGTILLVNKAYCEMTGYTLEELIGMNLSCLETKEKETERHLQSILETGFHRYETLYSLKDSSLLHIEINAQVSSFRGGSLILFARDISQRKRWEEEIQRHLTFQKMVAHISTSFVNISLHKIEEAVHRALDSCGTFFQVDEIKILQFSDDRQSLEKNYQWWNRDLEPNAYDLTPLLKDFLARDSEEDREILITQKREAPSREEERLRETLLEEGIKTFLCLPVPAGELTNFFCFYSVVEEKDWTLEDRSFLKTVVEIISNVFIRERTEEKIQEYTMEMELQSLKLEELNQHLDQEIDKAKQVHETTLLKTLPQLERISFAVHYQPAQKVGGDYYFCDTIHHEERILIYLSDVTGHGLDGAMLSLFVKNTINSYLAISSEEDITPEKILSFITNQYRRENYPQDYFICIYLAILETKTLSLSYLGAGFQDIPLLKRDGEEMELINSGLPISTAISPDLMNMKSKSITLTPGSSLFFYTDGLTEQEVHGVVYGDRVRDSFFSHSHLPLWVQKYAINEDFRHFNNNSLQGNDDITYLLLQIHTQAMRRHSIQLESRLEELKRLREEVLIILSSFTDNEFFMACLHEMVANAIEHGNEFHREKRVKIDLQWNTSYISAIVEDEGDGFNWREKIYAPLNLGGENSRGRGLTLTKRISNHYFYNTKGNKAYFILVLDT